MEEKKILALEYYKTTKLKHQFSYVMNELLDNSKSKFTKSDELNLSDIEIEIDYDLEFYENSDFTSSEDESK